MKIVKPQAALLSNWEVYQHILDTKAKHKAYNAQNKGVKRRLPENAFYVHNEVLDYLTKRPSPLREQEEKQTYSAEAMGELMNRFWEEGIQPKLEKGEALAIYNIRPMCIAVLNPVVEELDSRFSEDEQNKMVELITEVLGRDEPIPEEEEGEEAGGEGEGQGDETGEAMVVDGK